MSIENRLQETERRLGALLEDLGLKPILEYYGHFHSITFERPGEGRWRSPVQLLFPYDHAAGDEQPSWQEAHLGIHFIYKVPIGSNGWTGYDGGGKDVYPIPGTQEEVLDEIAASLRQYELFPFDPQVPNVINDMTLVSAWDKLSASFEEYGIDDILIRRDEVGEFVSFEFAGSSFQICFPTKTGDIVLEIDGEFVEEASGPPVSSICRIVSKHLGNKDFAREW